VQFSRIASRLARRRPAPRTAGNRRRSGSGTHARVATPAEPPSDRDGRSGRRLGRRGAATAPADGLLRRSRRLREAEAGSTGSPPGGTGWGRRALYLGLRLGIAGSLSWGLLVGVREGYAYATTSPRFEVRGLIYAPTHHVGDTRLRELLALSPGTNILSLDLEELAARVVADPWVAKASVVRVLPDSLQVTVEEHDPRAVLALGGKLLLVDAEGVAFKPLEPGERGRLPVITGFDDPGLAERPAALRERVLRGLRALAAYEAKRRPRLSELHVGDFGDVTLYTAELGTQLRLGRGDVEPALARFDALRAALGEEAEKLALVHLDGERAPGRPDRIVASFFPAKQAPSLLAEAEARAADKAAELALQAELQGMGTVGEGGAAKGKIKGSGRGKGQTKGKLPKYE
jgi:cell division protein FtsQ